jgi:hypothetical protein
VNGWKWLYSFTPSVPVAFLVQGSEILGFFDQPVRVNKNGETRLSFLWASEGEQVDVCDDGCVGIFVALCPPNVLDIRNFGRLIQ